MLDTNTKAIFFDAGMTLLHPHPSVGEIYAEVARRHGASVSGEQMDAAFQRAWDICHAENTPTHTEDETWWRGVVFKTLAVADGSVTDREAYFQELYRLFAGPEVWRLFPDTVEVLQELSRRGYKLGLISNWDARLRPLLNTLNLAAYFQVIAISCERGTEKPNVAIFEYALGEIGVAPSAALHVGDSLTHDVQGATRAGIRAVLLARNGANGYDGAVIRSLRELL